MAQASKPLADASATAVPRGQGVPDQVGSQDEHRPVPQVPGIGHGADKAHGGGAQHDDRAPGLGTNAGGQDGGRTQNRHQRGRAGERVEAPNTDGGANDGGQPGPAEGDGGLGW